jgi:hypothetical protein
LSRRVAVRELNVAEREVLDLCVTLGVSLLGIAWSIYRRRFERPEGGSRETIPEPAPRSSVDEPAARHLAEREAEVEALEAGAEVVRIREVL